MIVKKRLILASVLVLAILLYVQAVSAGCCVDERFGACTTAFDADECADTRPIAADGDYADLDCDEIPKCDVVCCFDTSPPGTSDAAYRIGCNELTSSRFTIFAELGPYEPSLGAFRSDCQTCTSDLVETCAPGSPEPSVITAYCDIRPPETIGRYVPTGSSCAVPIIADSDGDGFPDSCDPADAGCVVDVCPNERAITTEAVGTAPHFASEVGYCRDFIDNDCDGLTDYADIIDCPAPCTTDIIEICSDRSRVITHTCDVTTRELTPTHLSCAPPEAVATGTCGDGEINTPNEAFFSEQCDYANSAGADVGCGSGGTCLGEGDPLACTCDYVCLDDPVRPFALTTPMRTETTIDLSWGVDVSIGCTLSWFDIYRCDSAADCDPLSGRIVSRMESPGPSPYTHSDPIGPDEHDVDMCYQVVAHFASGLEVASDPVCTGAAPAECSRFDGSFCNDVRTAVVTCTETGSTEDFCVSGEFCREVTTSGVVSDAECVAQGPCDRCNGFLGLFGFLHITLEDLAPPNVCAALPSCAYDYSKTIVDSYQMCSDPEYPITSCYDYNSRAACEADEDHCSVGREGCEWKDSPNAKALGLGVCRPINEADQDCEKCNAEDRENDNTYFTGCTDDITYLNQQNCGMYGFDRSLGTRGLSTCLLAPTSGGFLCQNAADLGCRAYGSDETACIGERAVDVDVTWDAGTRTGNTNAILTPSNDAFEYGTCRFDMAYGGCFKDADGNGEPDCESTLSPRDLECQKDNIVPRTIITATDVPVLPGSPPQLLLGRNVDLDVSLSEDATTFFCIDAADGASCYPDLETVCKLQRVLPTGLSGSAVLRYYSEDTARNLEQVSEIEVYLDTDAPAMALHHTFDGGDRSLDISLSTSEEVTCRGILTDVHQGVVQAGRGSSSTNAIDDERGSSFSRTYYSVDDGVYVYSYTCWDEAGNRAIGEEVIVADTNRIHPLTPASIPPDVTTDTGDKVLTVRTEDTANCKYGPDRADYDRLPFTFTATDAFEHTTTITGCTDSCFKEYYVSCVFEDGTEEGNDQDVLRYSVDLTPPDVLAFNTLDADVEFDSSTVYGSTQNIFFQCKDNYFKERYGVIGYDFGCDTLTATDSVRTLTSTGDDMVGPFLVSGVDDDITPVTISTTVTDLDGNTDTPSITVTIDRTHPPLEITVYNELTGDEVDPIRPDKLGPLRYIVRAHSRGDVGRILSATARITDPAPSATFVRDIVLEELSRSSSFVEFTLNLDGIPDLETEYDVTITINAETRKAGAMCAPGDESIVWIPDRQTVAFNLDTHLPEFTLVPLLDRDETGAAITTGTSDYVGYPVYYDADEFTYYTNQTFIFLTGFVNGERTTEMIFFAGPRIDALSGTPAARVMLSAVASRTLTSGLSPIVSPASAGSDNILFGGVRPIDATKHYQFGDPVADPELIRTSYGNYMRMYSVAHLEGNTAYFVGELELDIVPSMPYSYGVNPWPTDWFGARIPLSQGENWVSIVAKSDTGITSIPEYRHVIVDMNAPEVIESIPGPSDTSLETYTISIIVRESKEGAPLIIESLGLDLNGTIFGYEDLVIIVDASDPEYIEYNISYTSDTPLNGTYHIRWIGHDKAANNLRSGGGAVEYDFTVGDGLPAPPDWTIEGALEHDGIWYTANDRAPFVVDFNLEASTVTILDVFYKLYESESQAPTVKVCTSPAANVYRCTYEPPLVQNQAYHFVIEAQKTLIEGPGPIGVYTSPPVVIDNTAPIIVDVRYQDPIAEDVDLPIEMIITNEQWPLQGEVLYAGDGVTHTLDMTANDRGGNYVFTWEIPNYASGLISALEVPRNIDITIQDYAGNVAVPWSGTLTLDMTPPSLLGFTFDPDVPFSLADHYYTSSTTLRISGEFVDADIDAIIIEPGNYIGTDFAPAAYASIRPDNTYEIVLQLEGVEDETTTNDYMYTVSDAAGNRVVRLFRVTVDLAAPEDPMITIS